MPSTAPLPNPAPLPTALNGKSRVLMGLLIAVVAVSCLAGGGWFTALLTAFVMTLCFFEFTRMMQPFGLQPSRLAFFGSMPLLLLLAMKAKVTLLFPVMIFATTLAFFQWLFRRHHSKLADLSLTLLTLLYLGFLPVHVVLLRNLTPLAQQTLPFWQQDGFQYVFMIVAMIAFSDIGAYYVGKRFGHHPLYPEISPKKTREGTLGGLFTALVVAFSLATWMHFSYLHAVILTLLMVTTGALGDLVESKIKRESGVKDSGGLLAGHGGILDRVDSYLFSVAIGYYYIHWVVLQEGLAERLIELFRIL